MNVVTGVEMHQIDRYAIEQIGLKEELLMENAGQAFVNCVVPLLKKETAKIAVLIGVGNNGGDGFVISRSLLEKGYQVDVWLIPPLEKVKGTARYHMDVFLKSGYQFFQIDNFPFERFLEKLISYSHLIDAMLGTGLKGAVRSPYKEIIAKVNSIKMSTVIAVDLPSGLSSRSDHNEIESIKAHHTVTLQCPKLSAFTYPHREYYGELSIVDIGIPNRAIKEISNSRFLWNEAEVKRSLPVRKPSSHKGSHGKGLIIAGSKTMTGAPILTTRACHRAGAGLITLAIPDIAHQAVASQIIEATFHLCSSKDGEINELHLSNEKLDNYDAIAIGPGLGRNGNGLVLKTLLKNYKKPVVIDADGLFYLKQFLSLLKNRKGVTVLTPHFGEFAYITGETIENVEVNRFELAKKFAVEHRVFLLLKGPFTIVTTPSGEQFINTSGNSSLAKGGSGDVLTGLILALMMQQNDLQSAISNAVFVHGKVADYLTSNGYSSLSVLASDLVEVIPKVLDQIQTGYHKYR